MEVNQEKREKFMEMAGKRVNNVIHDIDILVPMSRSTNYDFTKEDVDQMFTAMMDTLSLAKKEFDKKFEEKEAKERKTFSFGSSSSIVSNPKTDEVEEPEEPKFPF